MSTRRHPAKDVDASFDEHAAIVSGAKHEAAGVKAVMVSVQRGLEQMGPVRTAATLTRLNQRHGFDCPGCAWPEEPGGRKLAEFCENGAKAVAEEATSAGSRPDFFAAHPVDRTGRHAPTTGWASRAGSPTRWCCARGATHYEPIALGRRLRPHRRPPQRRWPAPTRPSSTPPGRTSNEAAFLYQLFVRALRHQQPARLLQHVPRVHRRRR